MTNQRKQWRIVVEASSEDCPSRIVQKLVDDRDGAGAVWMAGCKHFQNASGQCVQSMCPRFKM